MQTVISVEQLSKAYRLGQIGTGTFSYDLALWWAKLRGKPNPLLKIGETDHGNRDGETLWALKDVSFTLEQGEVLGIIGRNGAGKSTLLKILSRVTAPTSGRVKVKGRVASLLEVGTGFHPELTGRENIYLNGAILGMSRREIDRKFDEIVDFSGVEQFMDTPVKRYSSGMYVRLAFAVAAHLEPEILVVDEVLAVGDAEFQKKCLGKMGAVAAEGRTVLFVSHNMNAIQTLCSKAILLAQGEVIKIGTPQETISNYMNTQSGSEWTADTTIANRYFSPKEFYLVDRNLCRLTREISADESFGVVIEGEIEQLDIALTVGFAVYATTGELVFWSLHTDSEQSKWPKLKVGHNKLVGWIPDHFLNEGEYRIEMMSSLHYITWITEPGINAPRISISVRGGLSESPYWMMARPGLNAPILDFEAL